MAPFFGVCLKSVACRMMGVTSLGRHSVEGGRGQFAGGSETGVDFTSIVRGSIEGGLRTGVDGGFWILLEVFGRGLDWGWILPEVF